MIHELADETRLPSAVRLAATARYLGFLLGPAVGGVLLLAVGPTYGIFLNALIFLPMMLWLRKAPYRRKAAPPRLKGFGDVVATLKAISDNRVILSMVLLAGGASLFIGNAYQAQLPEFAKDLGHSDADLAYSMLLGADAAGALLAGVLLESRGLLQPSVTKVFVLAMLYAVAFGAFAVASSYPVALALLVVAGFLELAYNAMAQTLVQLHAPPHIRGRVLGLYGMSALGLRTFAGVTVGVGGGFVGIHWSLALSAGALFMLLTLGLLFATRAR